MKKTAKKKMQLEDLAHEMRRGFRDTDSKIGTLDSKINALDNKMDRGFMAVSLKIDKRVDDLAGMTKRQFDTIDTKLIEMHKQLNNVVHRTEFEHLRARTSLIEKRLEALEKKK